ncbi:MAG: glycosyltransferase family 2 protein [Gemmatimonadota bacterium]|nr:glycosyltransferase family 2 protein [Gemmatimonadota bacterium]MDP6529455.1 glycosyltransferase family 2 protein [Gemmatimonadota bacterium]MDP7030742.1 glycosyltransferase family 2 protein [Gemmatimonadota bacterium]
MTVSLILVNYNGGSELAGHLERLARGPCAEESEILVVDNGSDDGSGELAAQRRIPGVRVLIERENRGYAAGVNRGLREATGDVFVILNPDVVPGEGAVARLASAARSHPEYFLLGGTIVDRSGAVNRCSARRRPEVRDILREGFFLPRRRSAEVRRVIAGESGVISTDLVSGAAMAVLRTNLVALGPMDEDYFLYQEDVEWCDRARATGGRVGVVPDARFAHEGGASTRQNEAAPFAARVLSDYQYFIESRGVPESRLRFRWLWRLGFRAHLYRADAKFGILGGRGNSPERARIYRDLRDALRGFRWSTVEGAQNAHPDRLRSGVTE